jgi:hypothetical protein
MWAAGEHTTGRLSTGMRIDDFDAKRK